MCAYVEEKRRTWLIKKIFRIVSQMNYEMKRNDMKNLWMKLNRSSSWQHDWMNVKLKYDDVEYAIRNASWLLAFLSFITTRETSDIRNDYKLCTIFNSLQASTMNLALRQWLFLKIEPQHEGGCECGNAIIECFPICVFSHSRLLTLLTLDCSLAQRDIDNNNNIQMALNWKWTKRRMNFQA
jgi:hypothetical protein